MLTVFVLKLIDCKRDSLHIFHKKIRNLFQLKCLLLSLHLRYQGYSCNNLKYTLVRKSRTSAKIHGQVIPYFFKFRKRHNKLPRFRGAVRVLVCAVTVLVCALKVFVCAVKVFLCAVRVFLCAVSILFVLWAI